jgi:CheY-like chemotaxis protein
MAQKILVIDDDLFIREIYVELLKKDGYEVDSAVDGEDGLAKLQTGGYALTLLDLMMPKLDGIGVLDGLAKNPPQIKNGPIILLSNSGHNAVVDEGLNKGAASFLVKADLTPDQLLANIKTLLAT